MTKYKSELKAQIVHEYLSTSQSTNDLSKKYQINGRRIAEWVQGYQLRGINALEKRRHKRIFTADFKLNVIDYYQTHEDSTAEVAARFNILTAQVSRWRLTCEAGKKLSVQNESRTMNQILVHRPASYV
ncbi:hypothetical protein DN432_09580, partial [Lactobacillus reuteri]|uniref:transposase n=1 Tax=Limosilactobacillus reuteri TaxID=1598 RepID=UPI001782FBB3